MARVKWWMEGLLEVNVLLCANFKDTTPDQSEYVIRGMCPADGLQAKTLWEGLSP